MGILDRISTIVSSNLNTMLDKAEDPEKMLTQAIRDMEENLREAKVQVAKSIQDKKLLEGKVKENREQAENWEKKAMLAVEKNEEDLAKEALKRKKEYENLFKSYQTQLETQEKNVETLKSSLKKLDDKIDEAKRKKDVLVARQKRAEASKKVHSQVAKMSDKSAFELFDRMEDKIEGIEAGASAAEEIAELTEDEDLEDKFEDLDSDIDDELAALKAKMNKPE